MKQKELRNLLDKRVWKNFFDYLSRGNAHKNEETIQIQFQIIQMQLNLELNYANFYLIRVKLKYKSRKYEGVYYAFKNKIWTR